MSKYDTEEIAHTIIDLVEEAVEELHPELILEEGDAIVYGERYYTLEAEIAHLLRTLGVSDD